MWRAFWVYSACTVKGSELRAFSRGYGFWGTGLRAQGFTVQRVKSAVGRGLVLGLGIRTLGNRLL